MNEVAKPKVKITLRLDVYEGDIQPGKDPIKTVIKEYEEEDDGNNLRLSQLFGAGIVGGDGNSV